jgi:hypothetical protein
MEFNINQKVYWDNGSRHIHGVIIEKDVNYEDSLGKTRNDGIKVEVNLEDRKGSWGEQDLPEIMIYPAWSARLRRY